jgi:hypothetical protein
MDPRIRVVSSIIDIPVFTGSLYAFDIDDTLLKTVKVFDKEEYLRVPVDHRKIRHRWELQDPRIPAYLEALSKVASIIYITARSGDVETRNLTMQQFRDFSLPLEPVYYAEKEKSTELLQHLMIRGVVSFTNVIFADNLDMECREMVKNAPGVRVYRVDPLLATKLESRMARKK